MKPVRTRITLTQRFAEMLLFVGFGASICTVAHAITPLTGADGCSDCDESVGGSVNDKTPDPSGQPSILPAGFSDSGLKLGTGHVQTSAIDGKMPTRWGPITHRRQHSPGATTKGDQGKDWFTFPYLLTDTSMASGATCTDCLNIGTPCGAPTWMSPSWGDDTVTVRDPGRYFAPTFRRASESTHDAGCLISSTSFQRFREDDPDADAIIYEYDSNGLIDKIRTPNSEVVADYSVDTSGRITSITFKVKEGATTSTVRHVEYKYKNNISSPHSDIGTDNNNLVQVRVRERPTGGSSTPDSTWIERYTQYRYEGGSSRITAIFEPDAVHRMLAAGVGSTPEQLLALANSSVKSYATKRIEYYSSNLNTDVNVTTAFGQEDLHRYNNDSVNVDESNLVKKIYGGGGSGCCGGGSSGNAVSHFYYVEVGTKQGDDLQYTANIIRLVIEDIVSEDSSGTATPFRRNVYGLNKHGRILRQVTITDPTSVDDAKYWCSSWKISNLARITEYRMPSAHDVTSDSDLEKFFEPTTGTNDSDTLHASKGLIYSYEYGNGGSGFKSGVRARKGANNPANAHYVSAADYGDGATDAASWNIRKAYTYPEQTNVRNHSSALITEYTYTHWDDSASLNFDGTDDFDNVKTIEIKHPKVTAAQNGSNVATVEKRFFDHLGRLCWSRDGEGYLTYHAYHPVHGTHAYSVVDSGATLPTSADSNTSKWDASSTYGANYSSAALAREQSEIDMPPLALVSTSEFDASGRVIKQTQPHGSGGESEHYVRYEKNRTLSFPYWTGTTSLQPVSVVAFDNGGQQTAAYSVKPSQSETSSSGPRLKSNTAPSHYVSWMTNNLDAVSGLTTSTHRFHDLSVPSQGYYRTEYEYDSLGRRFKTTQEVDGPTKTQISETIFDKLGRAVQTKHGSTQGGSTNMATVGRTVYDGGDVGDGHVTMQIRYHDTGTTSNNGSVFHRTYRGHIRGIESIRHYNESNGSFLRNSDNTILDVDWLGRTTRTMKFGQILSLWAFAKDYDDYTPTSTTYRYAHRQTEYDSLGRVFRTTDYNRNSSYYKICVDNFYDRNGQRVASIPSYSAGTEYAFDGAGRLYQTRVVKELPTTKYIPGTGKFEYREPEPHPEYASSKSGKMSGGDQGVISIRHSLLNDNGDRIEIHSFELNHSDANGIHINQTDSYVRSSIYSWYDDANRLTATANYGSGDTSAGTGAWKYVAMPSRPATAPTMSTATKLVARYTYNADSGHLEATLDPAAKVTKTFRDGLGRATYKVRNFVNFSPSSPDTTTGGGSANDQDQTVKFEYDALDNVTKLTALDRNADGNTTTDDNEVTQYEYADTYNVSLATKETYPRGTSDTVTKTYYLDGTLKSRTDQRGVRMDYTYGFGDRKLEWEKATIPSGSEVDTTIKSIRRVYDFAGRLNRVRSYDGVGTGNIKNEIEYHYNSRNKVYRSRQNHTGATSSSSPYVYYYYDTTHSGGIYKDGYRNYKVRYPSGKYAEFRFGADDSLDDQLHRVATLRGNFEGSYKDIATYLYNGDRRAVQTLYPTPGVYSANYTSVASSHVYDNLDRFGRVVTKEWRTIFSTLDKTSYQYDFASNRTQRNVLLQTSLNQSFGHDSLHRLTSSTQTGANQSWTLDGVGNWESFSDAGTTQTRTHDNANEIQTISNQANPLQDSAGNMTQMPMANSSSAFGTLTYDAWNRLVKVVNSNGTTDFEYDGRHRRIVKKQSGSTYDYYYNKKWQVVETRKNGGATPLEMMTWHPHYIDAIASRYSQPNGSQVVRFAMRDASYNVTGLANVSGGIDYRYHYSAYGKATAMNGSWSVLPSYWSSDSVNAYTFTGRRFDEKATLYHYRKRDYSGELGRFVSRDPISYQGSPINLYEYVRSRPLVSVDPYGEVTTLTTCGIVGGAAVEGILPTVGSTTVTSGLIGGHGITVVETTIVVEGATASTAAGGACATVISYVPHVAIIIGATVALDPVTDIVTDIRIKEDIEEENDCPRRPWSNKCAEQYPGVPECNFARFPFSSSAQACRGCNDRTYTAGKGNTIDEDGNPFTTDGLINARKHNCLRGGKRGMPGDGVICGKCCVNPITKNGKARLTTRCKCAPSRKVSDGEFDDDMLDDDYVPDFDPFD